jgi:hypothetical protein
MLVIRNVFTGQPITNNMFGSNSVLTHQRLLAMRSKEKRGAGDTCLPSNQTPILNERKNHLTLGRHENHPVVHSTNILYINRSLEPTESAKNNIPTHFPSKTHHIPSHLSLPLSAHHSFCSIMSSSSPYPSLYDNDWTCRVASVMKNMCSAPNMNESNSSYDEESLVQAARSTKTYSNATLFDASRAKVQAMITGNKRIGDSDNSKNGTTIEFNTKSSKNMNEADMTDSDTDEDNDKEQQQQQKTNRQTWDTAAARIIMISGCEDTQTSADVSNVSSFALPDPNGRAGGACTSALLQGTSPYSTQKL